ncbi:MAG TPA: M48 family metalloprotease [Terriglobales bacterium]|nr:M48 family metalloprotease [Terriglobales bacterium]
MPVLRACDVSAHRLSSIPSLMLLAALCLVTPAAAQQADPANSTTTAAPATAAAPTAAQEKPPAGEASDRSGEIPTAAQITAAGEHDGTTEAAADGKPAPAAAPGNVAPATASAHAGRAADGSPLPAKDNVELIGQRNVGSGLDFYSLDREIALGRQLSMEVESSAKVITDPVITEYVNRIGQNLVRHSDARVPFTIKVLDNEEVNAFALPGGFFYVDSGLILAADNEAELAGVMSHEIAHVAARHATKNMTRSQIWNMAAMPLVFIGGPVAYAIGEVAGLAVPLSFLKFSRDSEREADLLGLEYDYASGYDPQAFVQFFEKLNVEKKKQNMVAKAFATHPMNVERIQAAQDEIRKYLPDRPEYVVDTSEFESIKARLASLENGRRLGGRAAEPGRPVLLKRSSTTVADDGGSLAKADDGSSASKDDGRPTLKRSPSSPSDLLQ